MVFRIPESVAVTVPIVALLAGVVGLLVITRDEPPRPAPVRPPATSSSPSGTPADRHTPTATRSSEPVPSATSTVCVPRDRATRLTVLTFNMHSARTHDGSVRLGTIAEELARWDADVVLLQEVDRGRIWTGRVDMPSVLAEHLGMTWTFGANVRRSATNQYGTAILSRHPIVASRNLPLPAPPGTQQRGLLHATIDVEGIPMSVYDTHLENASRTARLQQIHTITPVLRADPRPKIFGGDLNAAPSSPVLANVRTVLGDTWTAVGAGAGHTAPAGNPRVRIDYLLHRGGAGVEVVPLRAELLTSEVSDHRAVRATYRISTGDGDVCVPLLPEQSER